MKGKEKASKIEKKNNSFETLFENTSTNAFRKMHFNDERES